MYPLNCLISSAISSLVMDSGSAGASSSSSEEEAAFLAAFFPAAKCAVECFFEVAEEDEPNRATAPSCVELPPLPAEEEDNLYRAADLPATNDPEHANATMPRPYATFLSDIDEFFFDEEDSKFFCKSVAFSMSSAEYTVLEEEEGAF